VRCEDRNRNRQYNQQVIMRRAHIEVPRVVLLTLNFARNTARLIYRLADVMSRIPFTSYG
jgi:hypothetical protein